MRALAIALLIAQPALQSLAIEPSNGTLDEGVTTVFVAIGTYSNGVRKNLTDQVRWSSGDKKIATVAADGMVKGVAHGKVAIKARMGKIAARVELTVRSRLAIAQAPVAAARAVPQQPPQQPPAFTTAATMPAFVPVPEPVPEPQPQPEPQPTPPPVLRKVVLEPEVESLPENGWRQFKAWGRYSDGTVRDITEKAVWSSTDIGVVRADYYGSVVAVRHGTATISATLDSYSGVAAMTVTPIVARIVIRPADLALRHRTRRRLQVISVLTDDTFYDVTDRVTWTSSDERVAVMSDDGSMEGVFPGTATITAALGDFRASMPITVEAVIESIAIQPQVASLTIGQIQQLLATATFSDGTTKDVTFTARWINGSSAVRVTPAGLVTAMAQGTAVVKVRVGDVVGEASVEVSGPAP